MGRWDLFVLRACSSLVYYSLSSKILFHPANIYLYLSFQISLLLENRRALANFNRFIFHSVPFHSCRALILILILVFFSFLFRSISFHSVTSLYNSPYIYLYLYLHHTQTPPCPPPPRCQLWLSRQDVYIKLEVGSRLENWRIGLYVCICIWYGRSCAGDGYMCVGWKGKEREEWMADMYVLDNIVGGLWGKGWGE